MPISCDKIWKLLIDKNEPDGFERRLWYQLQRAYQDGKNEAISMESLYKICTALDYGIGDIVEFISDEND